MNDVYRNMIVTAADAPVAQTIAVGISPVAGANMWNTPLSATGNDPATHYISTGYIGPEWETLMPLQTYARDENGDWVLADSYAGQPQQLLAACQQYGVQVTQQQILDLFAHSDVTTQEPAEALARMGLKLVQAVEP